MVHPSVSASSLARNDERLALGYYIFRAIGALLGLAAILAQLTQSISNALASTTPYGSDVAVVAVNFFSFFTIQSNVLAVAVLAYGAIWGLTRGKKQSVEPRAYATVLAATTTYMVLTGIVYNVLLRGIALPQGTTVVWANEVLHVVIPLVMLIDLLFAPKRRALPWKTVWAIIAFPIAWIIYTLVRANFVIAPATGNAWWYPYPFLDPNIVPGRYLGVSLYIIGIALLVVITGFVVVWVGRRRAARADARRISVSAA